MRNGEERLTKLASIVALLDVDLGQVSSARKLEELLRLDKVSATDSTERIVGRVCQQGGDV